MIRLVPAWSGDRARRMIKSPRLVFTDSGLLGHIAGWNEDLLAAEPTHAGPLLENFAALELLKMASWSRVRPRLHHFRTYAGREVDIVLEGPDGHLIGIEVKAAATVGPSDFRGLDALRQASGQRFHRGFVLHTGEAAVPFGERLFALPLDSLWRLQG